VKDLLDTVRRRMTGRGQPVAPDPDPFKTLALQARLTRLVGEMAALDRDPSPRFARAHHARAACRAYDQTLAEACEVAGLPVPTGSGADSRLLAEAGLLQAGWTW
jgi:hypothetical protein